MRDTEINELYERGRAAWPEIEVPREEFTARVHGAEPQCDAAGLYLACACARGEPAAVTVFERDLMPVARAAATKVSSEPSFIQEALQRIRYHLLAGNAGPPRILSYVGRGPLAAWVRVVASRIAVDLRREHPPQRALESADPLAADPHAIHPAFLLLGARHADTFRSAIGEALRELTPRQRALLHLAYVEGLSGEDVAKLYTVNRSTVSRWLAEARDAVHTATAMRVKRDLDCDSAEADSLLRVLHTGFDDSLATILESLPDSVR